MNLQDIRRPPDIQAVETHSILSVKPKRINYSGPEDPGIQSETNQLQNFSRFQFSRLQAFSPVLLDMLTSSKPVQKPGTLVEKQHLKNKLVKKYKNKIEFILQIIIFTI